MSNMTMMSFVEHKKYNRDIQHISNKESTMKKNNQIIHMILIFVLLSGFGWSSLAEPGQAAESSFSAGSSPLQPAGLWYVAPGGSDAGDCLTSSTPCASINGALNKASSDDTIYVASGTYTSSGGDEVVLMERSIILSGGWNSEFTQQDGMSTIDGSAGRRGITVSSGITVTVELFIVQNGEGLSPWIPKMSGIFNRGALTLNNVWIRANAKKKMNDANVIHNEGHLILNNSAITENGSIDSCVSAIFNAGTLIVNNSTLSNNASAPSAYCAPISGIQNSFGTAALNNVTITGNLNGGIWSWPENSTTLRNSLVAGNLASDGSSTDCYLDDVLASQGYNLFGAALCTLTSATGDQIGAPEAPINAQIGPFVQAIGYRPLLSSSPAVNAGNPAGCMGGDGLLTTDQRGAPRARRADIGSYEDTTAGPAALHVSTSPPGAGGGSNRHSGQCRHGHFFCLRRWRQRHVCPRRNLYRYGGNESKWSGRGAAFQRQRFGRQLPGDCHAGKRYFHGGFPVKQFRLVHSPNRQR